MSSNQILHRADSVDSVEMGNDMAMEYLEQREAAAAQNNATAATAAAKALQVSASLSLPIPIDPELAAEFDRHQSQQSSPVHHSVVAAESPTNRRSSLIKYLDRSSSAADQFRREEQEWLTQDALGFAPVLSSATDSSQRRGNQDTTNDDSDERTSHGSSSGIRTRSNSDYDENDDLLEVDVHAIGDEDIFGANYMSESKEGDTGKKTSKHAGLRSKTSQYLDSDNDEEEDNNNKNDNNNTGNGDDDKRQKNLLAKARLKGKEHDKQQSKRETKFIHKFCHLLTHQNALIYRKKNVVRAYQTNCPVRFEKEWGISEGNVGDWVVWNESTGDMYCIKEAEFLENYIPAHRVHADVQENDHKYIKNRTVLARRIGYKFRLSAKKNELSVGKRGDYVMQPENGTIEDQFIVLSHQFHEKYQVVGSFSEYTELLKGVIMVSPSKELRRANSSAASQMHLSTESYKVSTLKFMTEKVQQILSGTHGVEGCYKDSLVVGSKGDGNGDGMPAAPSSSATSAPIPRPVSTTSKTTTGANTSSIKPGKKQIEDPKGTSAELGVGSWDFDLFQLSHESRHWPLFHLAYHLFFVRTNLIEILGIQNELMCEFLAEIDDTYLPVAYHNNMHGADVLHGCNLIVENTSLLQCLNPGEYFSFLVAGMCHDLSHPGTNNMFQIDSKSKIALKYNDCSVLENFHITTTFEILRQPQYQNLFPTQGKKERRGSEFQLTKEGQESLLATSDIKLGEYQKTDLAEGGKSKQTHWMNLNQMRKIIIRTILATDLAERQKYYREWDARALGEYGEQHKNLSVETKFEDRLLFMQMVIKCCDLKHPTLLREYHLRWSEMVNEEFIQQDIKETELNLPHRCPTTREPVAVAKSQAGFIRFLVLPTWTRLCLYVGGAYGK